MMGVSVAPLARTALLAGGAVVGLALTIGPAEAAGSSGLEAGGFFLDGQAEHGWTGAQPPRAPNPFLIAPSTGSVTAFAWPDAADAAATGVIPFTPRTYGIVLASPPQPAGPGYGESALGCEGAESDWSLGLGAGAALGEFAISAGGAYGRNGTVDPSSCLAPDSDTGQSGTAGVAIGLGDFTVGGSVLLAGDAGFAPGMGFQMGGSYALDALTVGIDWGRPSVTDIGGDMLNSLEFGASYSLGPGIAIDGRLGYIDLGTATRPDDGGFRAGIGAAIDF